jgi:hypothetical protein
MVYRATGRQRTHLAGGVPWRAAFTRTDLSRTTSVREEKSISAHLPSLRQFLSDERGDLGELVLCLVDEAVNLLIAWEGSEDILLQVVGEVLV